MQLPNWVYLAGIAISGLGGGGLAALVNALVRRRKSNADAGAVIVDSAADLIKMMRQELKATQDELRQTREEVASLRTHVSKLEVLLRENGLTPPPLRMPRVRSAKPASEGA